MNLREAMTGYLMDDVIAGRSVRYQVLKKHRLGYFVDWCEKQGITTLAGITPNIIRAFIVHLQSLKAQSINPYRPTMDKPLAPLTIKGYRMIVDAFFNWCHKEGLLEGRERPTRSIPQTKIPEYVIETFTPQQLAAMVDSCTLSSHLGFRDYAILLVLTDTGIRASELCGLLLENVHEDYIKVFGKGSKEREVGIGPTTSRALWKYINQYRIKFNPKDNEPHVFLGLGGVPLQRSGLYQLLERIGDAADVSGVRVSPHTFRHTFAVNYLKNGGEIFKLSRILGHSEMQTTQIYLKDFQSKEARAEHIRYSPIEQLKIGRSKQNKKKEK
jgi:integrase/recombinase XerD